MIGYVVHPQKKGLIEKGSEIIYLGPGVTASDNDETYVRLRTEAKEA